jgi:Response regulator receiver domain
LEDASYNEVERRELLNRVHRRFVGNLKTILSDGKLKGDLSPSRSVWSSIPLRSGARAMKTARVLLADDHALMRAGIRSLLEKMSGIELVAEAGGGYEALELTKKHFPNVVLMDIAIPGLNGLEALDPRAGHERRPSMSRADGEPMTRGGLCLSSGRRHSYQHRQPDTDRRKRNPAKRLTRYECKPVVGAPK